MVERHTLHQMSYVYVRIFYIFISVLLFGLLVQRNTLCQLSYVNVEVFLCLFVTFIVYKYLPLYFDYASGVSLNVSLTLNIT